MNPFISVFTDTADFTDVDNQLSTEMVSIPREEYEHLLLRAETAERMYWEAKQTIDQLARRAK